MAEQRDNTEFDERRAQDASALDERVVDINAEEEQPFMRGESTAARLRAPARLSTRRLRWIALGLLAASLLAGATIGGWSYFAHDERFRLESSDAIEVTGLQALTREEALEIFGADIGRNVFFIPLAERRQTLEQMPWVESATVMRILPNRIKVEVRERRPVATAQIAGETKLIDANGVLMPFPAQAVGGKGYWLPVIADMTPNETPELRQSQVKLFLQLCAELDKEGGNYSRELEEVYVSDPENVSVMVSDPGGRVMLELGNSPAGGKLFLRRYQVYARNIAKMRQTTPNIDSIDLSLTDATKDGFVVRPASVQPPSAIAAKPEAVEKPAAETKAAEKSAASKAAVNKPGVGKVGAKPAAKAAVKAGEKSSKTGDKAAKTNEKPAKSAEKNAKGGKVVKGSETSEKKAAGKASNKKDTAAKPTAVAVKKTGKKN